MDKVRDIKMRRWATRLGLFLHKSRAHRWSLNNYQQYAIEKLSDRSIVYGQKFELDLDQVEDCLKEYEAKLKAS